MKRQGQKILIPRERSITSDTLKGLKRTLFYRFPFLFPEAYLEGRHSIIKFALMA